MSRKELRLIDPQHYTANQRAEFRLPENVLLMSNFKLLNLGFSASNPSASGINNLSGALASVKNILLMDGSKVIDQIQNVGIYAGFKLGYNTSNQTSESMNQELLLNNMGLLSFQSSYSTDQEESIEFPATFGRLETPTPTNDVNTTPMAYIDLSKLLNSLRNMGMIHTGMFKNLRLVIEYDKDFDNYQAGVGVVSTYQTTQPLLAVHQINDENAAMEFMKDFKGVRFDSIESDQVRLNGIVPTNQNQNPVQELQSRLNAFNNKTINRILVSKNPLNLVRTGTFAQKLGSYYLPKQILQLRINGQNLMPSNGVVGNNQRLALLNESWGRCVTGSNYNVGGYAQMDSIVNADTNESGQFDYFGLSTGGKKVRDMQINFSRTCTYDATEPDQSILRYNKAYNINVFCEVTKELVKLKNGSFMVRYV